jgi:class I fructose-bisphosphate aldolase
MDHGASNGPIPGLVSAAVALSTICRAGPDAIIVHKGLARFLPRDADRRIGLIIHLSASTDLCREGAKSLVTGVHHAQTMGADGVSMHVNFTHPEERRMLSDLGRVADRCTALAMPLLVMAYLRGGSLAENDPKGLAIAARACAELGADMVKIPWPGSPEAMADIVAGCPAAVVMAGGGRQGAWEPFKKRLQAALEAGVVGVAAGRNVFQDADPAAALRNIRRTVHADDASPAQPLAKRAVR